jgi:hypothetical protein
MYLLISLLIYLFLFIFIVLLTFFIFLFFYFFIYLLTYFGSHKPFLVTLKCFHRSCPSSKYRYRKSRKLFLFAGMAAGGQARPMGMHQMPGQNPAQGQMVGQVSSPTLNLAAFFVLLPPA